MNRHNSKITKFNVRDAPRCLPGYKRSLFNQGARAASLILSATYCVTFTILSAAGVLDPAVKNKGVVVSLDGTCVD
jgi:hypothetical protein